MKVYRPLHNWGSYLWGFIHTISILDFEENEENKKHAERCVKQLKALEYYIPCNKCALHYRTWIEELEKRDYKKSMEIFRWSVDFHNSVNEKLEKKILTYQEALDIWTKMI